MHAGIPPRSRPPGADTPGADPPGAEDPPTRSRHPPGPDPPGGSGCWEIRVTRGRYASYWNAYLFLQSKRWNQEHVPSISPISLLSCSFTYFSNFLPNNRLAHFPVGLAQPPWIRYSTLMLSSLHFQKQPCFFLSCINVKCAVEIPLFVFNFCDVICLPT